MVLNILVTFSAYEREVTAERIRDKMAASRKKGLWVGGSVAFGYTSENKKLIVVPEEAETVRWIFNRFLETRSPKLICTELNEAKKLRKDGGIWNRSHIYRLLGNHTYIGKRKN
jgi:site-specific DNA recombinase